MKFNIVSRNCVMTNSEIVYLTNDNWNDYFEYIDKLLDKVIVSGDIFSGYEKTNSAYFTNGELNISSKITAVYEDIYTRDKNPDLSLFQNYATIEEEKDEYGGGGEVD